MQQYFRSVFIVLVAVLVAACGSSDGTGPSRGGNDGGSADASGHPLRLDVSDEYADSPPQGQPSADLSPGRRPLDVGSSEEVLVHVPPGLDAQSRVGLIVGLHGANGGATNGLGRFPPYADEHAVLLVAPASSGQSWDMLRGSGSGDIDVIDAAIRTMLEDFPVDPDKVAIAGFSDGASAALAVGLANGDLFSHVIAFSPGFIPGDPPRVGKPRIFITHGTQDQNLPIDETGRQVAEDLRDDGYDVTFRTFEGGHRVDPGLAEQALQRVG